MDLILRGMLYSEEIPNNLGIIFRKEYTDLRDSTVKDFEKYTGLKVDSQRNVALKNESIIMFRHIEELHNIQNINLGWFGIEQADELESDNEFFLLFGRLRRQVNPSDYFKSLELPYHSGFVIGNAGDHWGKRLWKEAVLENSECIEANTWDNSDVLPQDFLDSLKVLEKTKPEIYRRYVMNDWNVGADQFILISNLLIDSLKGVSHFVPYTKRIISIDPATGGDECVIYVFENTRVIEELILHINDTMKIVGELMLLGKKHQIKDFAVDVIGVGKGIADRLTELGNNVIPINSAEEADDKERFYNHRVEMWWHLLQLLQKREIEYFEDVELRRQLTSVKYKVINSNGKIQLEPKNDTKKRLNRSPDRADAFVYGIWGLSQIQGAIEGYTGGINKKRTFAGVAGW